MLASKNGQEVFMNKNSRVKLDFAATDASPTFNFYNFDDEKGNWNFRGKAGRPSQIKVNRRKTKAGPRCSSRSNACCKCYRSALQYLAKVPEEGTSCRGSRV